MLLQKIEEDRLAKLREEFEKYNYIHKLGYNRRDFKPIPEKNISNSPNKYSRGKNWNPNQKFITGV